MSGQSRRSPVELSRSEARKQDRYSAQEAIQDTIADCARRLERAENPGDADDTSAYLEVAAVCRETLVPLLRDVGEVRDLTRYGGTIEQRFPYRSRSVKWLISHGAEFEIDGPAEMRRVERAFASLSAIAQHEGIIEEEYRNVADATGFSIKIGEHHQDWRMDFGDPVSGVTRRLGALKSFYTGGTGGGKSAGASRQQEDYYQASLNPNHRDFKVFDPVGLSSENIAAYDLPQQQEQLRRAREEHGLAPDWTEMDGYRPEMKLYVPVTPDLEDFRLPYDLEADEFVPKPFTIPASRLSEGLLVALIDARVSDGQERLVREAYRSVDREGDDWSLDDLKYAIKNRDELSQKDTEGATTVLENLKGSGVFRTERDDRALDWEALFNRTDTVTVMNQMPLSSDLLRLVVVSHILDQVWHQRIRSDGYPSMAMWIRELWEIAPHGLIRSKGDDAVKRVKEHIIDTLLKVMRKPRDINCHIAADTQDATDPERVVRTRFNRYVVFGGNDDTLEEIFSSAGETGWRSFKGTLTAEPGHAGIIGGCEPAVTQASKWGISPVHLTPPSWHHYDKDQPVSGWRKRVEITQRVDAIPDEELRTVSDVWDIQPPEQDELVTTDDAETTAEAALSTKERARLQARQLRSYTDMSYQDIAREVPNNPDTDERYNRSTIMNWTEGIEKGSGELVTED